MAKKYYFQEVTLANNTNVQQFTLNTPDNSQVQRITELYVSDTTARHVYGLMETGDQLLTVGATRFAAGNDPLHLDITIPAFQPPTLTGQDLTGTGLANVGVTIGYEVQRQ